MAIELAKSGSLKMIRWIIFSILSALMAAPLMAQTKGNRDNTTVNYRASKSISFVNTTATDSAARDQLFLQIPLEIKPSLQQQGYRVESRVMAALTVNTDYPNSNDVTVYDATTTLISDLNEDGYYHRFNISIDADTIYDRINVYAVLYLSLEGGPWNEYASSDVYPLHKDSSLDSFTIETELADGFPPGYYDVQIELYDADTDQWLVTYGPYEDNSLSTLPLEDSTYDNQLAAVYPVETNLVVAGQGATGFWLVMGLPVLLVVLRMRCK